jgi:hypothetical protein
MPKKASRLVTGAIAVSTAVMPVAVSAQTVNHRPPSIQVPFMRGIDMKDLTVGTVTSINGNIITLNSRKDQSYTVDVSAATFSKGLRGASLISLADIKVGDVLSVAGTVNGTSVAATKVNDLGAPGIKPMHESMVNGTVTAISGSTLTVTGKGDTTYIVDASKATFPSGFFGTSLTLSSIQVGDKVMAMGTLNGTKLTASSIRDASFIGRTIFNGTVKAITGSMITLDARNNTTYSVDATAAKITKGIGTTTMPVSDIVTGDHLMIAGTLSGTTISATAIKDMGDKPMFGKGMHGAFGHHFGKKR